MVDGIIGKVFLYIRIEHRFRLFWVGRCSFSVNYSVSSGEMSVIQPTGVG
jgi:hypothetical protein